MSSTSEKNYKHALTKTPKNYNKLNQGGKISNLPERINPSGDHLLNTLPKRNKRGNRRGEINSYDIHSSPIPCITSSVCSVYRPLGTVLDDGTTVGTFPSTKAPGRTRLLMSQRHRGAYSSSSSSSSSCMLRRKDDSRRRRGRHCPVQRYIIPRSPIIIANFPPGPSLPPLADPLLPLLSSTTLVRTNETNLVIK